MSEFPYPGLRPFERDETDIFFGREEHADQLVDMLGEKHFIAVLGKAGCGKSSLVRSGLLGGLEAGFLSTAGTTHWRITDFRPSNRPFTFLARALLADGVLKDEYLSAFPPENGDAFTQLRDHLRGDPWALHEIMEGVSFPNPANLLILIDQFEELFVQTQVSDEPKLENFIELILKSCEHSNVYVVITMRSEHMDDCARFFELPEAINQGMFLTPRLKAEQLRQAIEKPALMFDDKVEEPLVKRLLKDMGNHPGNLPLLQHVLAYMWRFTRARQSGQAVLTVDHYEKIGGLTKSLSNHAEDIYTKELDEQQRKIAEKLFRRITLLSDDNRYIRQPVRITEAAEVAEVAWEQVVPVAEPFRKGRHSFLTPQLDKALDNKSVLDVTHESLINYWERLRKWTGREKEFAELYRRLKTTAQEWQSAEEEKKHDILWFHHALDKTVVWFEREQPSAAWARRYDHDQGEQFRLAMRFLEASKEKKCKEQQKEKEALRQKVRLRWTRHLLIVVLAALLAISGIAIWGFSERNQAREAEQKALASEKRAKESQRQAEQAKRVGDLNLFNSQLIQAKLRIREEDYAAAKKVFNETRRLEPEVSPSHRHARNVLEWFSELMGGTLRNIIHKNTEKELYTLAMSPGGRLLAAGGGDGILMLFDTDNNEKSLLQGHEKNIEASVFHPGGKWLASGDDDGRIIFWSASEGGGKPFKKEAEWLAAGGVLAMAVNLQKTRLASGGNDNNVTLWDMKTGKVLEVLKGHEDDVSSLAFDPAGNLLASASYDNTARLWDVKTGKLIHKLTGHANDIQKITFSPDGMQIATGSRDGAIRLWDVASGKMLHILETQLRSSIFDLQFIGDSLVSGGMDGKLRYWDIESGVVLRVLQDHKASVTALAGHDGELFSAGRDGAVMRWNIDLPYHKQVDLPGEPASAAVVSGDDGVAVGFADGFLRFYPFSGGEPLWEKKAHAADIQRIASNGSLLASAGLDKKAKVWRLKPGELPEEQATIEHENGLSAVAFSADGRMLATAGYDGKVGLLTIGAKEPVFLDGHNGKDVNSIAFTPDGTQLLSAGDDGVRLWDVRESPPALLQKFPHIQKSILWIAVSPDGDRFAATTGAAVNVHSLSDGKLLYNLSGHENTILRAKFSPDGQQLVTVSGDATVRFWDLNNGTELFVLHLPARPDPPAPLWDFDFRCTPKGCWIAVPLTRGKLVLYDLGRIYGNDG